MKKKWANILIIIIILLFIGYMIFDMALRKEADEKSSSEGDSSMVSEAWSIAGSVKHNDGKLKAVTVMEDGSVVTGGESFLILFNPDLKEKWRLNPESGITSVTSSGDTIYASTSRTIIAVSTSGSVISEWGPFSDSSHITSVSASGNYVAFADAMVKRVFLLDRNGNLVKIMGGDDNHFIIPSPYFDVSFGPDGMIYAANTGRLRVETWSGSGVLKGFFGEPGLAPDAFCGCCNPSHFDVIPGGFVTAEKGLNRIKLLDNEGRFVEFVSVNNNFTPSVPLDVASADGKTIYAVNPSDSRLYIFRRKTEAGNDVYLR